MYDDDNGGPHIKAPEIFIDVAQGVLRRVSACYQRYAKSLAIVPDSVGECTSAMAIPVSERVCIELWLMFLLYHCSFDVVARSAMSYAVTPQVASR
jgi:hypothetical protein